MKNLTKIIILLGLISLFACEKESPTSVVKDSVTANVLQNLTKTTYELSMDNALNTLETFQWTAPDYGYKAAITYTLQACVKGTSFANPITVLQTEGVQKGSITIGDFNKKLLDAGLEYGVAKTIDFRVVATIHSKIDTVFSNVVSASITPYATVFPPIYMCGDATGGWNFDVCVEMRSSAPSVYYTIAKFENGKKFRFFTDKNWSATQYKFAYFTSVDNELVAASDNDDNFYVSGATGCYAITVNLKNKTIVMEPVAQPTMYMIGGAVGGWTWGVNDIQMTWKSYGIFEATCAFSKDIFRFFEKQEWGATQYKYDYFPAANVSTLLELNANDNDKNFKFVGTPGNYKITLNLLDLKVEMVSAK